jgi:tetratricopeptide (TPR) repeat protein
MLIRLNLQKRLIRQGFLVVSILVSAVLVKVVVREFVGGTLADKRIAINQDLLNSAAGYLPDSGRLLARLAEFEKMPVNGDFESAERHLRQAIRLSPNNYRYRLLLAEIRDLRGDRAGAEEAFDEALRRAPNYSEVHWKFANFLVRENRIEDSVAHFRLAAVSNPNIFGAALDLVAAASDGNILLLNEIVKDDPRGQLKLALLLANQRRITEASELFSKIDKNTLLSAWENSAFLDSLIDHGFSGLAFNHWLELKRAEGKNIDRSLFWNGDFETETETNLVQFDWQIGKSDYARIGYDNSEARSGKRSLLFDFLGRDTVKLDNEVKHLVALRPLTVYRLEYYVKTGEFKTDEGPRVVVSDQAGNRIARSEPVPPGTNDWNRMAVSFTTPQTSAGDSVALFISVKRQPRFSYDGPARGRIWFDDFLLTEVAGK